MIPAPDGTTVEQRDLPRLARQLAAVRAVMSDGRWRTLAELGRAVGSPEASVSARLRDLRKAKFGGARVERRRRGGGLHEYRVAVERPNGVRLLIIDDDVTLLAALVRMLRPQVAEVGTADGRGGRTRLADYDVILCDVSMPDVNGRDVYDAAVTLGLADRMIFWSGDWPSALADRPFAFAARLDADGVPRLDKPASAETILAAVAGRARELGKPSPLGPR